MRRLRISTLAAAASVSVAGVGLVAAQQAPPPQPATTLRTVDSFASISDPAQRSIALFREAGRVITHPRCVNCHPATDRPLQGSEGRSHQPPVIGALGGLGMPGMQCGTCHGPVNAVLAGVTLKSVPGNPAWHLAPPEMAWEGKSLDDICRQITDKKLNGDRDLGALHEHMATDSLVGWGWDPGPGREPVPGTQAAFGELIKAWIDTGARCPGRPAGLAPPPR